MTAPLRLPQPPAEQLPRGLLIITRYQGATPARGSRIQATCKRDSATTFRASVPYDDTHGQLDAHYQGALALLRRIEAQNDRLSFTIQAVGNSHIGYAWITEAHAREAG